MDVAGCFVVPEAWAAIERIDVGLARAFAARHRFVLAPQVNGVIISLQADHRIAKRADDIANVRIAVRGAKLINAAGSVRRPSAGRRLEELAEAAVDDRLLARIRT